MIHINNLKKHHCDMLKKNVVRSTFSFRFRGKLFSCIFLTDIEPYQLYVTALGPSYLSIHFDVRRGYIIYKPFLENSQYKLLAEYLELKYNPHNPFSLRVFLEGLNKAIPQCFEKEPSYTDVVHATTTKNAADAEKIYFCGWKRSPTGKVSQENLKKTRMAFGEEYERMSVKEGMSSCWTANGNEENLNRLSKILNRKVAD